MIEEFPEYSKIKPQTMRENAARFKKEPEINNLILARKRATEELKMVEESRDEAKNVQEVRRVTGGLGLNKECQKWDAGVGEDKTCGDKVTDSEEGDAELENKFLKQLKEIVKTSIYKIQPRERLLKLKMTTEVERSSNRILEKYLQNDDKITVITDAVYAMGNTIAMIMKIEEKKRKRKASRGNRRERKLKNNMKELRQLIARTGNELYRRKKNIEKLQKKRRIF